MAFICKPYSQSAPQDPMTCCLSRLQPALSKQNTGFQKFEAPKDKPPINAKKIVKDKGKNLPSKFVLIQLIIVSI